MEVWVLNDSPGRIGVITTFFGYKGKILHKIRLLSEIFVSLGIRPYIQLHSEPHEEFDSLVPELISLQKEYDIEYSIHQSLWLPRGDFFINLGSSDPDVREGSIQAMKRSMDLAVLIGAKNVSFHAGYAANDMRQGSEFDTLTPVNEIPYEVAYNNVNRGLQELLDYFDEHIQLSIENLCYRPQNRYLFSKPSDFLHIPDRVGVLFDIGHAYYSRVRMNDPGYIDRFIQITGGKITEIHASDNQGKEDEHKLVGFGSIPFPEIFDTIRKFQRMPPVIIEATSRRYNYSDTDLKTSIMQLNEMFSGVGA